MINFREIIWNTTTAIVADTIALFSPVKANEYRKSREFYKRAYIAASTNGSYQLNRVSKKSGDAEVLAAREKVTGKVRDLGRNNPLVAGLKRKNATMVIGDEVGFKSQIMDASGKQNAALNAELEKRFYRWAESAQADGNSLTEALYLIENHLIEDGEVLVKDVLDSDAIGNRYRIQILETDYINSTKHDNNQLIQGIEFSKAGKPLGFWLYDRHPGGNEPVSDSVRVGAEDIAFLVERDRSSQRRGISPLTSCVFKLYGVDDLEDAELMAARSSAAFGLIVTSPFPETLDNPYATNGSESPKDGNGKTLQYLQSGGIFNAQPGETVQSFKSERANANFDPFIRNRERKASSATGMSYETATGDFSQVNFSSARMARLVEWANVRRRQQRIKRLLNSIYRKWLRYEVSLVGIPGIAAASYKSDPTRYEAMSWQLAGNDGIDPEKEIAAFEAEERLGVNSRIRFAAERGRDFEEICKERQAERELLRSMGLTPEPDKPAPKVKEVITNESANN